MTAGTSDITVVVTYKLHDHVMTHHAAVEAACTEDGSKEYWECSVCNKKFADETGTTELSDDQIVVPALGHDIGTEWTTDATGHWHACSRCDEKADFAAHTYGDWVHTGSHTRTCSVCEYSEHEQCTFGDWKVTKQPTATEKGEKERVCSKCAYVEKADIAATGTTEPEKKPDDNKPATGDGNSAAANALLALTAIAVVSAAIRRKVSHKQK